MPTKPLVLCAILLCSGPRLAIAQSVTDPAVFANLAASSNMFEIELSTLALDKATGTT